MAAKGVCRRVVDLDQLVLLHVHKVLSALTALSRSVLWFSPMRSIGGRSCVRWLGPGGCCCCG